MFNSYFIYAYNDLASYLISALYAKTGISYFPTVALSPIISKIEPLNGLINFVFFNLFEPITAANLLAILYLALMFMVSYKLFTSLVSHKLLAVIFSIFSTFSVYNLYRIMSFTTDLYQVFFIPLTLYLLYIKKVKPYYMSVLFLFGFGISIYTTYMCVTFTLFWYLSELFLSHKSLRQGIKPTARNVLAFLFPLFLVGGLVYGSVVIQALPIFASKRSDKELISNMKVKYRPIEDFYNLSFRPWYFVIPPQNSLFFADLSRGIYGRIEDTNYYLADDFTEEEAAGSYLGWHFIIGIVITYTLLLKKRNLNDTEAPLYIHKELLVRLAIVSVFILLISHPPVFTVAGFTIYTPTYLIYKILPVFRTLVRFGAVLYFVTLLINYLLMTSLLARLGLRGRVFIYSLLCLLTFVLMSIKVTYVNMHTPPQEIKFLAEYSVASYKYAVYPKGDYYSIFWILKHKKQLLNPVDFINSSTNFDANKFSKELLSIKGIEQARVLDAKLLVIYKEALSEKELSSLNSVVQYVSKVVYSSQDVIILELK